MREKMGATYLAMRHCHTRPLFDKLAQGLVNYAGQGFSTITLLTFWAG